MNAKSQATPFECAETIAELIENDSLVTMEAKSVANSIPSIDSFEESCTQRNFVSGDETFVIGSIQSLVDTIGPLSDFISRAYFLKVLDAIMSLHSTGAGHENLSVETVWLIDSFEPKLSKLESRPRSSTLSPSHDLFQKKQNENMSKDMFDLGVILFFMVSGFMPFEVLTEEDDCFKSFSEGNMELFWDLQEAKWYESTGIVQNQKFREHFRSIVEDLLMATSTKTVNISEIKAHRWCQGMSTSFEKVKVLII